MTALQLIFGMTHSNLCMYLRFGRYMIVKAFKSDSLAKIVIPSNEEIVSYKEAVGAIYPLLSDVWSTMDGLKLCCSRATPRSKLVLTTGGRIVTM